MASTYRNCQRNGGKSIVVLDGKNVFWDCPGRGCPCPKRESDKCDKWDFSNPPPVNAKLRAVRREVAAMYPTNARYEQLILAVLEDHEARLKVLERRK